MTDIRSFLPPRSSDEELLEQGILPASYDDRDGYDPKFLGTTAALTVPLPLPVDTTDITRPTPAKPGRPFELCYRRFSVVMSASRRFCWITAVNIDGGAPFFHPPRPGWRTDVRIPLEAQVGGHSFYIPTSFDRGHMVRRLDPVWGVEQVAKQANADTHHYTNACPQVHSFNDVTWGDLEDWILSQEQARHGKGTVFTGPIFGANDPVYAHVRVPVVFYKVVVVVDDATGRLSAGAFTMSQSNVLPAEGVALALAAFDPGPFLVDQVTIEELASITALDFGNLTAFDSLAQSIPPAVRPPGSLRLRLKSARDAVLWAP
jgi:endonuclease G